MGTQTILINGSLSELPPHVQTGADLRKHLGTPADRVIVVTLSDGSHQEIHDNDRLPPNIAEIDTEPRMVYGL